MDLSFYIVKAALCLFVPRGERFVFPVVIALLRAHGRSSALLMAAVGHGFEDAVLYYDHLMEHLRWNNLGHVLAGGNMNVGDVKGKAEIQQAFDLGKSIQ